MQILTLLSDILLIAATLGLAIWCRALSRRLKAFNDLDTGLGGTIAALSLQVDELKESLAKATEQTANREAILDEANARADDRIGRMEMLLASLEDIEDETTARMMDAERTNVVDAMPSFRASRSSNSGAGGSR